MIISAWLHLFFWVHSKITVHLLAAPVAAPISFLVLFPFRFRFCCCFYCSRSLVNLHVYKRILHAFAKQQILRNEFNIAPVLFLLLHPLLQLSLLCWQLWNVEDDVDVACCMQPVVACSCLGNPRNSVGCLNLLSGQPSWPVLHVLRVSFQFNHAITWGWVLHACPEGKRGWKRDRERVSRFLIELMLAKDTGKRMLPRLDLCL